MAKRILLLIAFLLSILLVLSIFNIFPFSMASLKAPLVSAAESQPTAAALEPTVPAPAPDKTQGETAPTAVPTEAKAQAQPAVEAPKIPPAVEAPAASAISQSGLHQYIPHLARNANLFLLQPGTPSYIQNFAHLAQGCNWMSVAGQVMDTGSPWYDDKKVVEPVTGLVVSVLGLLNGNVVNVLTLTGLAPDYGPGGYEAQLASQPIASSHALWVQVYDLDGNAVTEPIFFDTIKDCSKNVIIVNFTR